MKKLVSIVCAATMAVTGIAATLAPAGAAPVLVPQFETGTADVQQVRDDRRFRRQGNYYYYNGHRGSRDHRPGWRRHNGWWFPPAAFIVGAIVGGAIANQPTYRAPTYRAPTYRAPAYRTASQAHMRWCQDRYRSYRAYDNTFQPYYGPRQQCISPYMG